MPTKTKHGCFAKQELFVVETPLTPPAFQTTTGRQASAGKRAVAKVKVLAIYGSDFLFNRPEA